MKTRISLLVLSLLAMVSINAQEALTPRGSLNFVKEVKPPILSVVPGSVRFIDASGNNAIDAGETCRVVFDIQNSGMGDAVGCVAKIALKGAALGISTQQKQLPKIPVGTKQTVELLVNANMQTETGKLTLTVSVTEPLGFNIEPFDLAVHTRAFDAPLVKVADYAIDGGGMLQKNQPFDLQVAVQNMLSGRAEQVSVSVQMPDNVYLLSSNQSLSYSEMPGGKAEMITYKIIVPTAYSANTIPVKINICERYGKYAESRTIELPLNQQIAQHTITVDERLSEQKTQVSQVTLGSDVDKNIPAARVADDKTYVLIIANEKYQQVAEVPYALRDGEIFQQYCLQTLGVQDNHIKILKNATLNNMRFGIAWLHKALEVNPDAKAIIYYTGHGIPNESNAAPYLLPVDGMGNYVSTAYPVDDLYKVMGETNRPVTIFLDACFSGAKRDGNIALAAKGVAIKVRPGTPKGRTVVFSAATGDETAGFYRRQQHGMFTYWLLKAMQNNETLSYGSLADYLNREVRRCSFDENNGKTQTPMVMTGTDATDWRTWVLK